MINYPIKFEPILKEKIWGGNKLKNVLCKKTTKSNVGESWEISDVNKDVSVISNGLAKGTTLRELINYYQCSLLGKKNYETFGKKFPLLIKFIDADRDLSIQVHPDDEMAKRRHDSFGKTEMWYIMQADNNANLIVGFEEKISKREYIKHLNNNSLESILHYEKVKPGDSFFIDAGKVHAIGAGVMLAEIQQTSDITYRLYDWNRKDANGNTRKLHTAEALDAIKFNGKRDFKKTYQKLKNSTSNIAECPYFTTNFTTVSGKFEKNYTELDSFVVYMCTKGEGRITVNNHTETVKQGETVLLPAMVDQVKVTSNYCELLEVFI
ncbi:mannose-6-phosphate isomerase, type 1 [Aquimarina amphilecti]|uniref:Phosphohexomutase n=1 Tax=Aquimarina amphilecti TaxID=1038014 RepID=A0A1H7S4K2_AQUAM|nr:type I phosphomannose isomerase catalytic subunit [Aquimarina amphilecti]SEL66674.1 mannose-6-phosphate isomerase, type 1 [Aquimarina amphilecti]